MQWSKNAYSKTPAATAKTGLQKSWTNLDEHAGLVVGVGREGLRLLGGNGRVTLDQGGHDPAGGLNAEGERGDVEQQQVLHRLRLVSVQDGRLNRCAPHTGIMLLDRATIYTWYIWWCTKHKHI